MKEFLVHNLKKNFMVIKSINSLVIKSLFTIFIYLIILNPFKFVDSINFILIELIFDTIKIDTTSINLLDIKINS